MEQNGDRIIVLDDDPMICEFVRDVAQDIGFAVLVPRGVPEIRSGLRNFAPSAVFLDLRMPDMDGIEVIRLLAESGTEAQIVLASGESHQILNTAKTLAEKRGLRVACALQKPIKLEDLESTLKRIRTAVNEVTEAALEQGISGEQMRLNYQPKLSFGADGSWKVDSLEALVRWQHPDFGILPPDKFIGLAEESHLILRLTDYVIRIVLEELVRWKEAGVAVPVAVNLSARSIDDLSLPDQLAQTAQDHGVDPAMIILEITESGAMADVTRAMDVLTRLRLKGFRLSIDDFGTGYSSLVQLYRMPFSELKIDREFVRGLPGDRESATIVRGIVDLAHALELKVCVEGVETEAAFKLLREYGCDLYQGYHFCPPIAEDGVLELLAEGTVMGRPLVGDG